jgi:probable HAF family extracellular repeat protein
MSALASPARRCYVNIQVIVIVHALSIGAVQVRAQEYAVTNLSLGGSFTEVTDMNESGQTVGWATTTGNVYQRAFIAGRNGTHDLGTLGGAHSYAYGVNEAGQVVGYAQTASGHYHAFLYDGTTMHDLGTLGGLESRASGINDAGQIVGFAQTASGYFHAFLYDGITMHDLGTLGGNNSYGSRINATGQVVGSSQTASGQDYLFFYDGTTMHNIAFAGVASQFITSAVVTGFNDSGDVVGYRRPGLVAPPDYHAFLYDGTMRDLGTLGGSYSYASGNPSSQVVNEAGQVVGYAQTASGQQHAFLHDGTTMRDLGTFGGTFSFANAINEAGHVVGVAQTASSDQHAFLYDGTTMHDLGTFGGPFSGATDINQAGQVVGAASDMTNTWSAFLYDGTVIRNLNDHLTNAPAGTHLLQVVRIADNGSMVARSNAGWVLLSNSSNAHAPTVGPISLDVDPVPSGTTVSANAAFTDGEVADTHTAEWTWGDGSSSPGTVSESEGAGDVAGTHLFSAAGI